MTWPKFPRECSRNGNAHGLISEPLPATRPHRQLLDHSTFVMPRYGRPPRHLATASMNVVPELHTTVTVLGKNCLVGLCVGVPTSPIFAITRRRQRVETFYTSTVANQICRSSAGASTPAMQNCFVHVARDVPTVSTQCVRGPGIEPLCR